MGCANLDSTKHYEHDRSGSAGIAAGLAPKGEVARMGNLKLSVGLALAAMVVIGFTLALGTAPQQKTGCEDLQKDAKAAIATCTALIESGRLSGKNLADAFYHRGRALQDEKQLAQALKDFDEVIRLDPRGATFRLRSTAHFEMGQYAAAIADLDEAIRLDPNDAVSFILRGNAHHNIAFLTRDSAEDDRAIEDMNEATRLNSTYPDPFFSRGIIYAARGQTGQALAEFDEAIRLDKSVPQIFFERAKVHDVKGDIDRAIADYDAALGLDPNYADARQNRAVLLLKKGDHLGALRDFHEAVRLRPEDPDAILGRCGAFAAMGQYDRAIKDCDAGIRLAPNDAGALCGRRQVKRMKGDAAGAAADLAAIEKIDLDIAEKCVKSDTPNP